MLQAKQAITAVTKSTYHYATKRKSETVKYGEGDPHLRAKRRVADILDRWIKESNHYLSSACVVETEVKLFACYKLYYNDKQDREVVLLPDLIDPRCPERGRKRFFHPFDIVVKLVHLNKLVEFIFIEIDGKWHEKKKTQLRDREVERIQSQVIPDGRFVRIPIGEAKHATEKEIIDLVFWSVFTQRR